MRKKPERPFDDIRRQLDAGKGDRLHSFEVDLEPPYLRFEHFRLPAPRRFIPSWLRRASKPTSITEQIPVSQDCKVFMRLQLSTDDDYHPERCKRFFASINTRHPVFFETVGTQGNILMQLAMRTEDSDAVSSQILAHYPQAEFFESFDLLEELNLRYVRGYCLARSHIFPLPEAGINQEPYTSSFGVLGNLALEESGLIQFGFIKVKNNWSGNIAQVCSSPFDQSKSLFADSPNLPKMGAIKTSAPPIFAVVVRTAASSLAVLERLDHSLISQYHGELNGLRPI